MRSIGFPDVFNSILFAFTRFQGPAHKDGNRKNIISRPTKDPTALFRFTESGMAFLNDRVLLPFPNTITYSAPFAFVTALVRESAPSPSSRQGLPQFASRHSLLTKNGHTS